MFRLIPDLRDENMLDYDVIFMLGIQNSFKEVMEMNAQIRKSQEKIGFIFIDVIQVEPDNSKDFDCIYFADFGKDFIVYNSVGKNSISIPVEKITNSKPGIVTLNINPIGKSNQDHKNSIQINGLCKLNTGDYIRFKNV